MADRKALSKSIRFEVFKRDYFKCQYCGRTVPEVVLEVDHIVPVAEGGTNDIHNLITSCRDCNRGKGKRKMSDTQILDKQADLLTDLAEKKEQADMMIKWVKSLHKITSGQIDLLNNVIHEYTGLWILESDCSKFHSLIIKNGFREVYEATIIAIDEYCRWPSRGSLNNAISKIGGICHNRKKWRTEDGE